MMRAMKPYSEHLLRRFTHKDRRIVRAVEGGMSKSGAARLFGVSLSSVKRYLRIAQRGMSLAPRKAGRRPPKTDQSADKLLEEDVKERPAATTVSERPHFLEHTTGKSLSASTVKRLLKKRLGFSQENALLWGRGSETNG
jgi:transposase